MTTRLRAVGGYLILAESDFDDCLVIGGPMGLDMGRSVSLPVSRYTARGRHLGIL